MGVGVMIGEFVRRLIEFRAIIFFCVRHLGPKKNFETENLILEKETKTESRGLCYKTLQKMRKFTNYFFRKHFLFKKKLSLLNMGLFRPLLGFIDC